MKKPIVVLENVHLEREEDKILRNINWTVFPGEHWAIIGQNAAGKTLLLKIIATYLWPTRGSVEVLGEEFGSIELHKLRQKISWISSALEQELPQNQSVIEVVLSGYFSTLRLFDKPTEKIVQRARKFLQIMGLNSHEKQIFETLSVGEKKKSLIARAMIRKPRLLILDEVCAGLDPIARRKFINSLRRLIHKESNITILYVTHHLEEIFPEITHVLGLKNGKIAFSGKKQTQLNQKNMNFLFGKKAKLRKKNQTYYLDIF